MHNAEVGRVVSLVGLGVQCAGALLLAALFALLVHAGERGPWFRAWARAWAALAAALGCVAVFFASTPSPLDLALLAGYQGGKVAFFLLLAAGARAFAVEARPVRARVLVAAGVPFVAASLLLTRNVGSLMALQTLVAVPALVTALAMLARARATRRSFGLHATAGSVAALTVLWLLYLALDQVERTVDTPLGALAIVMASYNSYVDLLLQTVLAFGMVLLASEEAHRELADAHRQLNAAHEHLRGEALRDALTGALNRRAFSALPEREPRLDQGGCVVLVDFDGFKEVNDTWGHETGDALLRHFVGELRTRLREGDLLYRLGGDEFVLVVPGATPERLAPRFADMLLAMVPLDLPSGDRLPVRASWGLGRFEAREHLAAAVREADRCMYASKRSGAAVAS